MSKTLHTVKVQLAPQDAIKVMQELDKRQEGWQLVSEMPAQQSQRCLGFEIWVEGSPTTEKIRLLADGTWTATTHVVLGEKQDG